MAIHPGVKGGGNVPAPLKPAMEHIIKLAKEMGWKISKVRIKLNGLN